MRTSILALPLALCLAWLASCVATPLPDPPSLDTAEMSLTVGEEMTVTLVGQDQSITPGGFTLRVTNPTVVPRSVEVPVDAQGAFSASLPGVLSDTLYLEDAETDRFIAAVGSDSAGGVLERDAGPDGDNDGSPDIVDCAPADDTVLGSACGGACITSADCSAGFNCTAGVCGP